MAVTATAPKDFLVDILPARLASQHQPPQRQHQPPIKQTLRTKSATDGGTEKESTAMAWVGQMTKTVEKLNAEEASALTRLHIAMLTGSPRLTGVMKCRATETTSANLESALAVLAVQTTAAKIGGRLKQTDVPTSLATKEKINAEVTWSARDSQVFTLACFLILKRSLSQAFWGQTQQLQTINRSQARAPRHARSGGSQRKTGATASSAKVPISAGATPVMGSSRLAKLQMLATPSLV